MDESSDESSDGQAADCPLHTSIVDRFTIGQGRAETESFFSCVLIYQNDLSIGIEVRDRVCDAGKVDVHGSREDVLEGPVELVLRKRTESPCQYIAEIGTEIDIL